MKILSITAQKPHSTGSGTYMTELVRAFDRLGHEQAVVAGIYPDDKVNFPEGVDFFPVYFNEVHSPDKTPAQPAGECEISRSNCDYHLPEEKDGKCEISHINFPICGMSDVMPYASTRYCDLSGEMIAEWEREFTKSVDAAITALDPDIILCHHLFLLTSLVKRIVDRRAELSCGSSAAYRESERMIYGICHGTDLRQIRNASAAKRSSGAASAEGHQPLWAIDIDDIISNIRSLDRIFALHEAQAAEIADIFKPQDSSVINVLGSGYNNSLFNTSGRIERKPDAPVRICYAGKVSSTKGIPELLYAFETLNKLPHSCNSEPLPVFEVTLIGGCNDPAVEKLLEKLPDNIKYLGQMPQAELARIFRANDILVLPSFFEGLPLVLIEAMACGLVPISTNLPGLRTWIEAHVGASNVRYIPMPEMKSVDEPTEAGREKFCIELTDILANTIRDIANHGSELVPDTLSITWDEVAKNVLANC